MSCWNVGPIERVNKDSNGLRKTTRTHAKTVERLMQTIYRGSGNQSEILQLLRPFYKKIPHQLLCSWDLGKCYLCSQNHHPSGWYWCGENSLGWKNHIFEAGIQSFSLVEVRFHLKFTWLVVEPTHFKNMQPSNWIISPEIRGENSKNMNETTT